MSDCTSVIHRPVSCCSQSVDVGMCLVESGNVEVVVEVVLGFCLSDVVGDAGVEVEVDWWCLWKK